MPRSPWPSRPAPRSCARWRPACTSRTWGSGTPTPRASCASVGDSAPTPCCVLMNVTPEFASPLGPADGGPGGSLGRRLEPRRRDPRLRARWPGRSRRSTRSRRRPDAVAGEVPVLVNTGAKSTNVAEFLEVADGVDRRQRPQGRRLRPGTRSTASASSGFWQRRDRDAPPRHRRRDERDEGRPRRSRRPLVAQAERPVELASLEPGWAEEDPAQWWENVCSLCRELAGSTAVAAVGVSGMVPAVDPARRGRPPAASLDPAERRARGAPRSTSSAEALRTPACSSAPARRSRSSRSGRRRCGSRATSRRSGGRRGRSSARTTTSPSGSTGVRRRRAQLGARERPLRPRERGAGRRISAPPPGSTPALLPPVRRADEIVGGVTARGRRGDRSPRRDAGRRRARPITSRRPSRPGSSRDGDLLVKLGSAGDILLASDEPLVDERLYLDFHLVPGKYLPNGCMAASGSFIRWFQRELAGGASLEALDAEAEAGRGGCGRNRRAAVPARREDADQRPGRARRVRRAAPRPRPRPSLPGGARGDRLRLPPPPRRASPSRGRVPSACARHERRRPLAALEAGRRRRDRATRSRRSPPARAPSSAPRSRPGSASARSRLGARSSASSRSSRRSSPDPTRRGRLRRALRRLPGALSGARPVLARTPAGRGGRIGSARGSPRPHRLHRLREPRDAEPLPELPARACSTRPRPAGRSASSPRAARSASSSPAATSTRRGPAAAPATSASRTVYTDHRELLERADVDCVLVAMHPRLQPRGRSRLPRGRASTCSSRSRRPRRSRTASR